MTVALQTGTGLAASLDLTPARFVRSRKAAADLRAAFGLRRLCWTLAWLDIKLRYRGSLLGPFWLTLSTGVMVGSMGVIYSTLFKMNLHDYLPFLALSLVLWNFLRRAGQRCLRQLHPERGHDPFDPHAVLAVCRRRSCCATCWCWRTISS